MLSVSLPCIQVLANTLEHKPELRNSRITIWDKDGRCESQAGTQPSDVAVELCATGGAFARRTYDL